MSESKPGQEPTPAGAPDQGLPASRSGPFRFIAVLLTGILLVLAGILFVMIENQKVIAENQGAMIENQNESQSPLSIKGRRRWHANSTAVRFLGIQEETRFAI